MALFFQASARMLWHIPAFEAGTEAVTTFSISGEQHYLRVPPRGGIILKASNEGKKRQIKGNVYLGQALMKACSSWIEVKALVKCAVGGLPWMYCVVCSEDKGRGDRGWLGSSLEFPDGSQEELHED